MSQLTTLSEGEKTAIEEAFPLRTFEKGAYLMRQGEVAREGFYVVKGCVREYVLLDGEEKTTGFFTEDQTAADFNSLAQGIPTNRNFVCMEETTTAVVNAEKEAQLYAAHPRFETFCRTGMEQIMGAEREQMVEYMTLSPEQRYRKLVAERPGLLNRVPQYYLASYLGIKPETLSRVRKRIASGV